ncbi:MAG: zinc-ribbon domain-containing protein [Novosphingobium sp.]
MIIACPACNTRYAVPDSAIGVDGRTVRCAKCRHSWFQDGPRIEAAPPPPPPPPPPAVPVEQEPEPQAQPVEPAIAEPEPEPVPADTAYAEEPAPVPPPLPEREPEPPPPYADDDYDEAGSSFRYEPPFRARRNPAKMWMLAALLFAAMSLGAVAAVAAYGLPDWVPFARPTFAEAQPGLQLDFPANRQERRTLPDKSVYFGLSGTITNTGATRRSVPSVLIVFRGARNQIVFSQELVPPKRVLAPGETVEINEALTVPRSARFREIGWKPG